MNILKVTVFIGTFSTLVFVEVTESEIERTPSESDGESSTSPTQYVARELLDTVIKNAVEIVQSGNKQSYVSCQIHPIQ